MTVFKATRLARQLGGMLLGAALIAPRPAAAQTTYVGAALMGDVVRFDRVDLGGSTSGPAGGESLGFALRLGTPLGRMWGVELELARPGLIESDETPDFYPLLVSSGPTTRTTLPSGVDPMVPGVSIVRPYSYRIHTARRHTTFSTSVWAAQDVSPRVSLVYLGGAAFHRSTFTADTSFELLGILPISILPPSLSSESLVYSVRPMAGFEARIDLTEHTQLVPGIRMHGLAGGWLVRPAVGLAWTF